MNKENRIWAVLSLLCGLITPWLPFIRDPGVALGLFYLGAGILGAFFGIAFGIVAFKRKSLRVVAAIGILLSSTLPVLFLLVRTGVIGIMAH